MPRWWLDRIAWARKNEANESSSPVISAAVTRQDDGGLTVTGMDAPAIADVAAGHGVAVHELVPRHASLEQAYLDLTGDSTDYRARKPAGEGTARR